MKKFFIALIMILCVCVAMPAFADSADEQPPKLTLDGAEIDAVACYNSEGALCLQLLPVAQALGYTVDKSELSGDGDATRIVYTFTPAPLADGSVGSQLMVAYSMDGDKPSAVAISKDQIMIPLKQSMTLVDGEPYLPTEFFETGMCLTLAMSDDRTTLDISLNCAASD